MKIVKININQISKIKVGEVLGLDTTFDIYVEMEYAQIKDLITRIWDKYPDEFEEVIKSEGMELTEATNQQ